MGNVEKQEIPLVPKTDSYGVFKASVVFPVFCRINMGHVFHSEQFLLAMMHTGCCCRSNFTQAHKACPDIQGRLFGFGVFPYLASCHERYIITARPWHILIVFLVTTSIIRPGFCPLMSPHTLGVAVEVLLSCIPQLLKNAPHMPLKPMLRPQVCKWPHTARGEKLVLFTCTSISQVAGLTECICWHPVLSRHATTREAQAPRPKAAQRPV